MGFLDNTSTTVDAILTKKGRELLAKGDGQFKITRFRLSDDEIDYSLYDTTHQNGSNFFGAVIENISLLEAFPVGKLKYFLINASEGTTAAGIINIDTSTLRFNANQSYTFEPTTDNVTDNAYIFTLSNSSAGILRGGSAGGGSNTPMGTEVTARGKTIRFTARRLNQDLNATMTIEGLQSGARVSIPLAVKAATAGGVKP